MEHEKAHACEFVVNNVSQMDDKGYVEWFLSFEVQ